MSSIDSGIANFSKEIKNTLKEVEDIFGLQSKKTDRSNYSKEEPTNSIALSRDEMKAFVGLCSLEGTTTKEKIAELIKNYIEEKRKQMKK